MIPMPTILTIVTYAPLDLKHILIHLVENAAFAKEKQKVMIARIHSREFNEREFAGYFTRKAEYDARMSKSQTLTASAPPTTLSILNDLSTHFGLNLLSNESIDVEVYNQKSALISRTIPDEQAKTSVGTTPFSSKVTASRSLFSALTEDEDGAAEQLIAALKAQVLPETQLKFSDYPVLTTDEIITVLKRHHGDSNSRDTDYIEDSALGLRISDDDMFVNTTKYNADYNKSLRYLSMYDFDGNERANYQDDFNAAANIIQDTITNGTVLRALATIHEVPFTDIQLFSSNTITQISVTKAKKTITYSVPDPVTTIEDALKDPSTKDEHLALHKANYLARCAQATNIGKTPLLALNADNLVKAIKTAANAYKKFSADHHPFFVFAYRSHGSKGLTHVKTLVDVCSIESASGASIHTALKTFFTARADGTTPGGRDHSFVSFLLDELATLADLTDLGLDSPLPKAAKGSFQATDPKNVQTRKAFIAAMKQATVSERFGNTSTQSLPASDERKDDATEVKRNSPINR